MTSDLRDTLNRLSEKSRFLTQRYRRVSEERKQALDQVEDLRRTLRQRDKELQTLRMQVEYLTVVSTIAPSRESLDETRARIAGLMREIDRCIADLKE